MGYRVVQWSTDGVGLQALRGILNHPGLELVGVLVRDEAEAGRDAGELAGGPATGVRTSTDADELLGLIPDCVCYTAERPAAETFADVTRILQSGANVVVPSLMLLTDPNSAAAPDIEALRRGADEAAASLFVAGSDTGFNHLVGLALASGSERVDAIRVTEIVTTEGPLPEPADLSAALGATVRALAAGLGWALDALEEDVDHVAADHDTVAGLRLEVRAMAAGVARVVVEHVLRLHADVAPSWPQPTGSGCYRIVLDGEPSLTAEVQLADERTGDHAAGGRITAAMRLVNAIPAVCRARPGLLSALDIPFPAPPTGSKI